MANASAVKMYTFLRKLIIAGEFVKQVTKQNITENVFYKLTLCGNFW